MSKQKKYLVLTVEGLEALIKVAKKGIDVVILDLEAAGKDYPGQLTYTDTFQKRVWAINSGFDSWGKYQEASVEDIHRRANELKEPKADSTDMPLTLKTVKEDDPVDVARCENCHQEFPEDEIRYFLCRKCNWDNGYCYNCDEHYDRQ
jgi:hypothetical protein